MLNVAEIFPTIQGEGIFTGEPSIFVRTQGCSFGCVDCDTKYSWETDPKDVYTPKALADKLVYLAGYHGCKSLVVTGGEPFEQPSDELLALLEASRKHFQNITIETAGFVPETKLPPGVFAKIIALIDNLSISPKLPSFWRGHVILNNMTNYYKTILDYLKHYAARKNTAGHISLKFVISNPVEEFPFIDTFLQKVHPTTAAKAHVILQPNGYTGDNPSTPLSATDMLTALELMVETFLHSPNGQSWPSLYHPNLRLRFMPQLHRLVWGIRKGI